MNKKLTKAQFGINPQDLINLIPGGAGAGLLGRGLGAMGGGGQPQPGEPASIPDAGTPVTDEFTAVINDMAAIMGVSPEEAQAMLAADMGVPGAGAPQPQAVPGGEGFDIQSWFQPSPLEQAQGEQQFAMGELELEAMRQQLGIGGEAGLAPGDELNAILSLLPLLMEAGGSPGTPSTSSSESYSGGTRMQEGLPSEMQGQAPNMAPTWDPQGLGREGNVMGHNIGAYALNQGAQNDYLNALAAFFAGTMEQLPSYSSSTSVGGMPGTPGDPTDALASAMSFLEAFRNRGATGTDGGARDPNVMRGTAPNPGERGENRPQMSPVPMMPDYRVQPPIPQPGAQFPGMTAGLSSPLIQQLLAGIR